MIEQDDGRMAGRGATGSPWRALALAAFAATVLSSSSTAALAMQKLHESGTFDCSCKNGSGTCTFESSTDNTDCFKGNGATCTGSCTLTLTPNKSGAAMQGKAVTGGMKAVTRAKKQ